MKRVYFLQIMAPDRAVYENIQTYFVADFTWLVERRAGSHMVLTVAEELEGEIHTASR